MVPIRFLVLAVVTMLASSNLVGQEIKINTVEASVSAEPTQENLFKFRRALLTAAEQSVKSGEITRVELFKLRIATANPAALKKIHQCCTEQVVADGKAKLLENIDWEKLLAFIKELLPIILELIKLLA